MMTDRQTRPVPHCLLMLGFGLTGQAVCEYATKQGISIAVSESGQLSQGQQEWLTDRQIPFEHSGHTKAFFGRSDTVVLSPGIPMSHPLLVQARQQGLAVISELDLAMARLKPSSVVAVTGTNGKSSTVEVIAKILKTQGRRAWVAGNIGIPLIGLVDEMFALDTIVLEISSYQLEQSSGFRPNVGVLLTLSPDHLRRHGSMRAYAKAKGKLFANQQPSDVAILPRKLASQFTEGKGRRVFYDEIHCELPADTEKLLPHEQSNFRAAFAACQALLPGLSIEQIPMDEVCSTFRLPHRMESLGHLNGVHIINDSKSTNAGSTLAALQSINEPVVLLLGGRSKGAGYEMLVAACPQLGVREVLLFGEAADELKALFMASASVAPPVTVVDSMQTAIDQGLDVATTGDVLLLSPGCSSFDAFEDYVERGRTFAAIIRSKSGFIENSTRT